MNPTKPVLTLLYDGQCPICSREIMWLEKRNSHGQLNFQDIQAETFDPSTLGVSMSALMAEIHGITSDGQLLKGIDVFAIVYSTSGLKWLAAPLQWPLSRPLFIKLYSWFAKYRKPLGKLWHGKSCQDGSCRI